MGIDITSQISVNGKSILFSNLCINQYLADVNSFSFTWREKKKDKQSNYQEYVSFYQNNLAKQVIVKIGTGNNTDFTFKGFISSISCSGNDDMATEYSISGKGDFAKFDEIEECNSYYKKTLSDIVSDSLKNTDYLLQAQTSKELFYTVQYNQTKFGFLRLLAIRYGEWLFYDGQQMIFGPVFKNSISVQIQKDILDVNISAKIFKASEKNVGFNTYEGKQVEKSGNDASNINNELINAGSDGGNAVFGSNQTYTNSYTVLTNNESFNNNIKDYAENQMHGGFSNGMYMTAKSGNSKIALGTRLSVLDEQKHAMGEYIVIQINHFSNSNSFYQNSFVAVPSDLKKPPYVNAQLYPICKSQPAIVVDNEDDKKLGRIKVRLPWQQPGETTPWLPVMVPHAGKNKGFHFLPEKNDQVMIDFIGNNAERPYVIGAFYTEENGHGNDHTGNNVKVIGTRTGRRLEINDDKGYIKLQDFNKEGSSEEQKGSQIVLAKTSDGVSTLIDSGIDNNNYAQIMLTDKSVALDIKKDGDHKYSIIMNVNDDKIVIHSKGSIEISADKQIDINSGTININASQELNLKGTQTGVNIKGKNIKADADKNLELAAMVDIKLAAMAMLEVSATTSAKLDGGPMTTIKGGMVMIN